MQDINQRILRSVVLIAFACAASHAVAGTGWREPRWPKKPDDLRSHTNQDRTPPLTLHTNQDAVDLKDFWKGGPSAGNQIPPPTVYQSPTGWPETSAPLDLLIEPFDLADPVHDALIGRQAPIIKLATDPTSPLIRGSNGLDGWIVVSAPVVGELLDLDSSLVADPASRELPTSPVPAPGALSLFGLAAVAAFGRRRRRN